MFNGVAFNRAAFNQTMDLYLTLSAYLHGNGILQSVPRAEITSKAVLSGAGNLVFTISQRGIAELSGVGNMSALISRDIPYIFSASGSGSMHADGNRYTVETVQFTGDFAPGDAVVIDSEKFTVKINGLNALSDFTGDFLQIRPGINTITYSDQASTRTISLIIKHRDRWL